MKKLTLITLVVFALASNSWATTYTGELGDGSGGLLIAGAQWNSTSTILSWTVDDTTNAGLWTYSYDFTVPTKNISHVLLEVSSNFTSDDWKDGTTPDDGTTPKTFSGGSNITQGMPGDLFGFKWTNPSSTTTFDWTIVTDRAPMWGDFYARDGSNRGVFDVYAYNIKFGTDTTDPIGNGNDGGWALVPDTVTAPPPSSTPEPITLVLYGMGFAGVGLYRRMRGSK